MEADAALLERYAATQDADAFAQMVERYSGMVYATCLRLTRNTHDAEDASQQCFLSLARKAGTIRSSLAGWLHATARNASLALVKDRRERKEREAAAMSGRDGDGAAWSDLEPHIDAALAELPDELRSVIVLCYLQGKTQQEAAEVIGADRSTVSRHLQKGVDELRRRLEKAGVALSIAALVGCLGQGTAQAAPPALTAALGKIAVAGVGKAAAASGVPVAAGLLSTTSAKLATTALLVALAIAGGLVYNHLARPAPSMPAVAAKQDSATSKVAPRQVREPMMEKPIRTLHQ